MTQRPAAAGSPISLITVSTYTRYDASCAITPLQLVACY